MKTPNPADQHCFARGALVLSIDTEQIWGHFDLIDEVGFLQRFPDSLPAHDRLLDLLCSANISATWTIVGALSLKGGSGPRDQRFGFLPEAWSSKIPPGDETSAPLWYRRSFVERLHRARVVQDIGLHGGLSHLMWSHPGISAELACREFEAGSQALQEIGIQPRSFVFPRDLIAHLDVLSKHGIRCYRGRAPIVSERLGLNLAGRVARLAEELGRLTPPPVWPEEVLPGLWNIPASMPLYSLARIASRLAPLPRRLERVRLGIAAAVRLGGIFHLCFHPENLAESPWAFSVFETILEEFVKWRDMRDVEILTMSQVVDRVSYSGEGSVLGERIPVPSRASVQQVGDSRRSGIY